MDTTSAGKVMAEQMAAIERDYEGNDDVKIAGTISIIVIEGPQGSTFRIRSNLGNPALTLGVLRMAEDEFLRALREPGGIERGGGEAGT